MGAFLFMMALIIVGVLFLVKYSKEHVAKEQEQLAEETQRLAELKREKEESYIGALNQQIRKGEALRQAQLTNNQDDVTKILDGKYDGPLPEEVNGIWTSIYPDKLMILSIAGINYRTGIEVYVGDFNGVLVPEPQNDYDPSAIMIKCEDGHHLGYVPEDMTADVRQLIGEDFKRHRITGRIDECEDDEDGRKFYVGRIYIVK